MGWRPVPGRLVVLASGAGTTLQAVLDACRDPAYGADVVAVGVDRFGTGAQRRADAAGVPVFTVRLEDYPSRQLFDTAVIAEIERCGPDLVVLAGYMKVLGPAVVARFPMVNTHPSLLPSFPGAHAVRDALAHGVKVTGVTVHWVDEGVDTGPILAQEPVYVRDGDTEDGLRERIQSVERGLYVRTIGEVLASMPASRAPVPPVEAMPQGGGQAR
jgi:phosphoribosylglycinamide formyltransferase-1